jgi:hypothetical protein
VVVVVAQGAAAPGRDPRLAVHALRGPGVQLADLAAVSAGRAAAAVVVAALPPQGRAASTANTAAAVADDTHSILLSRLLLSHFPHLRHGALTVELQCGASEALLGVGELSPLPAPPRWRRAAPLPPPPLYGGSEGGSEGSGGGGGSGAPRPALPARRSLAGGARAARPAASQRRGVPTNALLARQSSISRGGTAPQLHALAAALSSSGSGSGPGPNVADAGAAGSGAASSVLRVDVAPRPSLPQSAESQRHPSRQFPHEPHHRHHHPHQDAGAAVLPLTALSSALSSAFFSPSSLALLEAVAKGRLRAHAAPVAEGGASWAEVVLAALCAEDAPSVPWGVRCAAAAGVPHTSYILRGDFQLLFFS